MKNKLNFYLCFTSKQNLEEFLFFFKLLHRLTWIDYKLFIPKVIQMEKKLVQEKKKEEEKEDDNDRISVILLCILCMFGTSA